MKSKNNKIYIIFANKLQNTSESFEKTEKYNQYKLTSAI